MTLRQKLRIRFVCNRQHQWRRYGAVVAADGRWLKGSWERDVCWACRDLWHLSPAEGQPLRLTRQTTEGT